MSHLLDNVVQTPFWWDAIDTTSLPQAELPAKIDVAVVGAGYTGLSAAATLAHSGRSVLVWRRVPFTAAPEPAAAARQRGRSSRHSRP